MGELTAEPQRSLRDAKEEGFSEDGFSVGMMLVLGGGRCLRNFNHRWMSMNADGRGGWLVFPEDFKLRLLIAEATFLVDRWVDP
jgi:hypothetical protein